MTDHLSAWPFEFPPDFAAFQAGRQRFFDRLAAEEDAMDPGPLTLNGELTVLTAERRLVLGYFGPRQRDLADAVSASLGFEDEAFGVGRVGAVRITIERLQDRPA